MINKLQELKSNFATYSQTTGSLIKRDSTAELCFCAQGILALTWGAPIVNKAHCIYKFKIYESLYHLSIPYIIFSELGLPPELEKTKLLEWREKLELTECQINDIEYHRSSLIAWTDLNDYVKLTFHQFSLLIDLLDKL